MQINLNRFEALYERVIENNINELEMIHLAGIYDGKQLLLITKNCTYSSVMKRSLYSTCIGSGRQFCEKYC